MKKDIVIATADIFCILIFAIPLLVYNLLDVVPVTRNGFFCSDNEIRYPYHSSTVSSAVLVVVGFVLILLASIVIESWLYKKFQSQYRKSTVFHPLLVEIYRAFGYFVIGMAMNQFLTDIIKSSVGRLRPHFFDLCQPNITCTAAIEHEFIENYYCTRTSHPLVPADRMHSRLIDARKSFPSGHASFSLFSSLYIIAYVEYRARSQKTRIVRHLFQLGVVAWGQWVAWSRIFDFKHRMSDVAAGMLLGTVVGIFAFYLYVRSHLSRSRREKTSVSEDTNNRPALSHSTEVI